MDGIGKLTDLSLKDFLDALASKEPVPGGGSIAASHGATAAALVEMVANLTINRKKYQEVQEQMLQILEVVPTLRAELLMAVDKDAEAYAKVMAAYKLPKDTDEAAQFREMTIQSALKEASEIPMSVARWSYRVTELAALVIDLGNKNAVTDGLLAQLTARAAVLGACYNVEINLEQIQDSVFVTRLKEEIIHYRKAVE